jgi:hypothetical protein
MGTVKHPSEPDTTEPVTGDPVSPPSCGWFELAGPLDDDPNAHERCTSGKPALFYSCEFNGDVPVCEDHKCRCDQASIRRHREFGDARKSVADARNALVEEILVRKRREDHVVYFADIATLFENVARAEARLALAETAIRDAKKAAGQP